ncbi:MAG: hypothetical protein AB7G65_19740 [Thermoleophilia bacterium]
MFNIGDEVEVVADAPIARGSIVNLMPGDRGIVEGVSGDYVRVRVSGYPMLVKADALRVVRHAPPAPPT